MFLRKKADRAMKWSRERRMRADGRDPEQEELDEEIRSQGKTRELPSMEQLRAQELEDLQNEQVDRRSILSMIVSAFLVIFPVCVGVIVAISLIAYFFFYH